MLYLELVRFLTSAFKGAIFKNKFLHENNSVTILISELSIIIQYYSPSVAT